MFSYATAFNQDISQRDMSQVTPMDWMFGSAVEFNHYLSDWNVTQVTSMDWMFAYGSSSHYTLCWDLRPNVRTDNIFIGSEIDGFYCRN